MKRRAKGIPLEKVLKRELKNPEFRFYFEHEKAIGQIAMLVRTARQRAGMTQAELAMLANTNQAVIARLESGSDKRIPSLDLLQRIARALQARLMISLEMAA